MFECFSIAYSGSNPDGLCFPCDEAVAERVDLHMAVRVSSA